MSRARTVIRLGSCAFACVLVSACTLVSGWSDLQNGHSEDDAGGGGNANSDSGNSGNNNGDDKGASGSSSSSSSSSSSGSSGATPDNNDAAPTTNVKCGNTTCTGQQGCCRDVGTNNSAICTGQNSCDTSAGEFFLCLRPADCPSATPVCCYDFTNDIARCKSSCSISSGFTLCDKALSGSDCAGAGAGAGGGGANKQCVASSVGVDGVYQCN